MNYDIKLCISYEYADLAVGGRHVACVAPLEIANCQTISNVALDIHPEPDERVDWQDFFGNNLTQFSYRGSHQQLSLNMRAQVVRLRHATTDATSGLLRDLPEELANSRDVGPDSPLHFLSASPRAPLHAELIGFAVGAIRDGITLTDAVVAVGKAIYDRMLFDPTATSVDTPSVEAFCKCRGVCQDFSHIMISCLRGIGIPAGYVSGFLRTLPPPGKPRLEGADAMHAWVRAWCGPKMGWIEFDPTNNCFADENHIVVAYGRDYSDVAPIKGAMWIAGGQRSRQTVDVIAS